jgi:beta-glucosidase
MKRLGEKVSVKLVKSCFLAGSILVLFFNSCKNEGDNKTSLLIDKAIEEKIDSVMDLMTLEEKVGQMVQYNGKGDATGPIKARPRDIEDIKNGLVGSMLNVTGAENTREMQRLVMENSRIKIPLIFGLDVIHGYKTIFPVPLGEAASWDLEAMEQSARIAAIEASAAGVHWTFAPMVDICRDARWGRIMEGAGEDTYYGSKVSAARVRGFQGKSLADTNTIVACAKHFAGYGFAEAGRDYNTVDVSERVLNEIILPPFKAAVDAGVGTFMNSFNELDGVPATGNNYLVNKTLNGKWGFKGFVVSDWNSIGEMMVHGVAKDTVEAVELAVNAGNNMDMETLGYRRFLVSLIKEGKVSEKLIDESVRRILRIKFKLGLFDDPYRYCSESREKQTLLNPVHIKAAREIASKSMVLLKNQGQLLPLKPGLKNIAVIGPLADSKFDMIGNWSAKGEPKDVVTLLEGIKLAVGENCNVVYEKGCNIRGDSATNFQPAIAAASRADVVIMAVGEASMMSGEAYSRAFINIPGNQEALIKEVVKTGKPVVMVLFNGRPLTINWEAQNVPAILEAWLPGTQAGNAIADVLFGKYNPSGKLPVTFPYAVGQIPVYYNHKSTGRPLKDYKEKWFSRYIDIPNEPLFPFGFGLSYTTFSYSNLKLSTNQMKMGGDLTISVTVKNTGNYDGEEVVQLYTRDLIGSITRPVKELKGFKKIMIKKGESQEVTFTLKSDDLAFYTRDMTFKAEPGDFTVFVGTNSVDCLESGFSLVE